MTPSPRGAKMKKKTYFFVFLFVLTMIFFFGQEKILNIKFKKELSMSFSETDGQFPRGVRWMDADSEGNCYILDRLAPRILKFDPEGELIKIFGQNNQEPGRLESPTFMVTDSMNMLYVHDQAKKALVVFDSDGEFIRYVRYDNTDISFLFQMVIDASSRFICGYRPFSEAKEGRDYRISRFDSNFNHQADIYFRRDVFFEKEVRRGNLVFSIQPPPFTPKVHWTMDASGRIYVNYSNSYRIKIFSDEGVLVKEIHRDSPLKEISPAELALMRKSYGSLENEFIDLIPFPKFKPPVSGLYLVEGFLFVRQGAEDTPLTYDIFDNNHTFWGTTTLNFVPFLFKNGCVYAIDTEQVSRSGGIIPAQLVRYGISFE
jgi:hypothetical protein